MTYREVIAVYVASDGRCGICGASVQPEDVVFDHIQPVASGGPDTIANLHVTHVWCNARKGDQSPRVIDAPRNNSWTKADGQAIAHFRRQHGITQTALAQALGVSAYRVYLWESGKQGEASDEHTLWRALEHLDCTARRPPPTEER